MLLRLTATEATGRAAFAVASVAVAFVGHATLGHGHCDISQLILAGFLLLFASWRTRRTHHLLMAAIVAQLLVHGGLPSQPHMALLHSGAAVAALALMTLGESAWQALARLLIPALPTSVAVVAPVRITSGTAWRNIFVAAYAHGPHQLRGPPVFA